MDFAKEDNKRVATLSSDIVELKQLLLSRIEKVEAALREAEQLSTVELQRCEALRQEAETRAASLESQLEENEEQLREKEATMEQLEESLNAEIQDLEDRLAEKDKLIEARDTELKNLKFHKGTGPGHQGTPANGEGESLARIKALQEQLEAQEKHREELQAELTRYREQATANPLDGVQDKELGLLARICDLEQQLKERDDRPAAGRPDSNDLKFVPEGQAHEDSAGPGNEEGRTQHRELQDQLKEKDRLLEELRATLADYQRRGETGSPSLPADGKPHDEDNARIQALEQQLRDQQAELEDRAMEITDLKRQRDVDARHVDTQIEDREEDLRTREANMQQLEESLNSEIQDLEDRLNEKESLLQASQMELKDLREKMSAIGASPQGFLILKEEDVVIPDGKEKKGIDEVEGAPIPIRLDEEMSAVEDDAEELKARFREQETRLAAKDIEIKMMRQVMQEKIKELEKVVNKQEPRKPGKSRLVSFLADIQKRH